MRKLTQERDFEAPEGSRVIGPDDWQYQRYGWLESVRRDASLSAQAQLLAHVFVLDFSNKHTVQCDPSMGALEHLTGRSKSTIKRAISELVEAGWMVRITGRGRGRTSGYGFLTRGKVVRLKGAHSEPFYGSEKGSDQGRQKGSDQGRKGFKSEPPYIIDKPCKNLVAREGVRAPAREASQGPSKNPMVIRAAERAVARLRSGHRDALSEVAETTPWVITHIIAANLLTPEERDAAGLR